MVLGTVLWFLLILSFLVVVHELGHYLAAKWAGVRVEEFGLGYPPRVRKLFTRWNTLFSLNAIPVGGFVKLYGDDAETLETGEVSQDSADGMFSHQPQWKRLIIILAGVAVNFVFGILAFSVLFSIIGIPTSTGRIEVSEITAGSPAEAAGFQTGDTVLQFTAEGAATRVTSSDEFIALIADHAGDTVRVTVRRGEDEVVLEPTLRAQRPENDGLLGVGLNDSELKFYPWWQMPLRGAWQGWQDSLALSRLVLQTLGRMVTRLALNGEVPQDLSGPVGIVRQAYEADILSQGVPGTVHFIGQLSVNLAIMNLLPIPALDGGRAVFIVLENILGKKRRAAWEQQANLVGFIFLLAVIFLVTAKDIMQIFR